MRNVVNIYICLTKVGVDPHNVAWELCVNAEISMIVYSISTNTQQCLAIIKKQSLYLRPHYIRVEMTPFHIDFLKWFRYLISTNATYLPIFFSSNIIRHGVLCVLPSIYICHEVPLLCFCFLGCPVFFSQLVFVTMLCYHKQCMKIHCM